MSDAPSRRDDLRAISSLGDARRRELYEYVVAKRGWVGRDEAADAVGLGRGAAAHHLDRLAADGLLEATYKRLSDRTGPGAGRPAKVYRRASRDVGVSVPPRDYELAARLLAEAAERSLDDGSPVEESLRDVARDEGRRIAADIAAATAPKRSKRAWRDALVEKLRDLGFEPERVGSEVVLHNCPFHSLARRHTELVCGMNLCLLDAATQAASSAGLRARLEPVDGLCCVRLTP